MVVLLVVSTITNMEMAGNSSNNFSIQANLLIGFMKDVIISNTTDIAAYACPQSSSVKVIPAW